jgi:hypothetical protein
MNLDASNLEELGLDGKRELARVGCIQVAGI